MKEEIWKLLTMTQTRHKPDYVNIIGAPPTTVTVTIMNEKRTSGLLNGAQVFPVLGLSRSHGHK